MSRTRLRVQFLWVRVQLQSQIIETKEIIKLEIQGMIHCAKYSSGHNLHKYSFLYKQIYSTPPFGNSWMQSLPNNMAYNGGNFSFPEFRNRRRSFKSENTLHNAAETVHIYLLKFIKNTPEFRLRFDCFLFLFLIFWQANAN